MFRRPNIVTVAISVVQMEVARCRPKCACQCSGKSDLISIETVVQYKIS